ncbi:MAG TPA: MFS transporter [Solirubrobacteraceae bacterium]|nr:MFS transporter [Solirubrobacteraceae bacterium]
MKRSLVILLATACGLSVGNTYYVQPLLDAIARDLHAGPAATGLLVTVGQLGYAAGLVLLVPLGDLVDRRRLITGALLVAALGLAGAAVAPGLGALGLALAAVGITSVVAQILVPFAATLAPDAERGRIVGSVMTGLMVGTLLSRTLAGLVAQAAGWRAMFWLGAVAMVALAALLSRRLPHLAPTVSVPYRRLLGSIGTLVAREPVLRLRAAYGALAFALMSVFWTTLAFLLASGPYGFGEAAIGIFSLIAIPAAFAAPYVGRFADSGHVRLATGAYLGLIVVGLVLALAGATHIVALAAAAVLITGGAQALHVTNQSEIYALDASARSRITTAYMSSFFAGGTVGSALAAMAYAASGWTAVVALGGAFAAAGVALWLWELTGARGTTTTAPPAPRLALVRRPSGEHGHQPAEPAFERDAA